MEFKKLMLNLLSVYARKEHVYFLALIISFPAMTLSLILISMLRACKSKEGRAITGRGSPLRKVIDEQANALNPARSQE